MGSPTAIQTRYEMRLSIVASPEFLMRNPDYALPPPLSLRGQHEPIVIGNSEFADLRLPVVPGISDEHGELLWDNGKVVYADRYTLDGTSIIWDGEPPICARDRQSMELADLVGKTPPQPVRLRFPGVDGLAISCTFSRKA